MAYVGTPIDVGNQFSSLVGKRFSGDASTTAFTLDVRANSALDIEVFVENVRQDPNSAYTVDGTTLTFTAAPPSGTNNVYVVHQAPTVASVSPTAGSVTASSFDNSVISGHTALAATPADTDEFLISDAGTIKRIDFSHLKQANTPAFSAYQQGTGTSLTQNTYTKVVWDSEYFDTNSAFSSGTFTVPSGKAGKYFFTSTVSMQDALAEINIDLYKNGSSYWRGSAVQGSNVGSAMSVAGVIDLAAGDYVEVYVKQNQGTNAVESGGSHSHFQGFKLI
tara:strand:+ start:20 stop:853 length:834 start_codon:yes stop_codon:yes gene_type:complete